MAGSSPPANSTSNTGTDDLDDLSDFLCICHSLVLSVLYSACAPDTTSINSRVIVA